MDVQSGALTKVGTLIQAHAFKSGLPQTMEIARDFTNRSIRSDTVALVEQVIYRGTM